MTKKKKEISVSIKEMLFGVFRKYLLERFNIVHQSILLVFILYIINKIMIKT